VYRIAYRFVWFLIRLLLRSRYRVQISGLELLKDLEGPTLVLPNHPAYIDPPLVLSHVRMHELLRPVVYGGTYRNPVLYPFMRLIGAVEVPELAQQSRSARAEAFDMIDAVVAALKRGQSILIYPSGRLQRKGETVVGAARATAELLQACPEANVVLIRTQGVWGSMFSCAQTGRLPALGRCMLWSVALGLANLVFFLPRRQVTMEVKVLSRDDLPGLERETLNPFLEQWYNRDGPDEPVFVPYHFLSSQREFDYPDLDSGDEVDQDKIQPATRDAVNEMIEEHLGRSLADEERNADASLDRLGLDSLDRMDIALAIEQRFGFRSDEVANRLGQLWALAEGLATRSSGGAQPAPAAWTRRRRAGKPAEILADTVAEAFVRRVLAHPGDVAVADQLSGVLTYRRLLVGAHLLSKRFAQLDGHSIGVLLPASVAADVVLAALFLAGKLPVLLNWTTGPANLSHAIQTMEIRHVVTSQRFVDRLGIEIKGANYAYLETIRGEMGRMEMAATLLSSYISLGSFLRRVPRPDPDEPAVVLFTSGSESTPKAVPLTHRNLITDIGSGLTALQVTEKDVVLGFLPPFHSFGLVGNLLAALLTGIGGAYYPDPTDAAGLVRTIVQYRPTLLFTTPTFLGYMLAIAKVEEFESLKLIATGAEKCPEAVRQRCAEIAPGAIISEGYGITECSPVVSLGQPGRIKQGTVGEPLPVVDTRLVHPETHEPVPDGETGLLLLAGPTIFGGYLNYDGPDPFVEAEGRRWYNTGDLVAIDDEGYIHFRGRLKRFLKVGGEMVSLPALEEPLAQRYPPTDDGPQVAVEGIETPGGRRIVLFSTLDVTVREANAILSEAGFRGVMRLDEARRIDKIPVLGTGKTDYKVLRKLVQEDLPT
jgi:acyl-CoA synthetase (AMP-forming)/AMP-acid ligase II/1-acyl-sn-glycerol-3-phosphate acyltransferase/acyl carrier protein